MMAVHTRNSSLADQERKSLEMLAEVLKATSARDQMLEQLEQIATVAKSGVPFDPVVPRLTYLGMLTAIEESANLVRNQSPKTESTVAEQSALFYRDWFVQFYSDLSPKINALWPFLAKAMGVLPLGLQKINPRLMTIKEWNDATLERRSARQTVISLERLGFRQTAEQLALNSPSDDLMGPILQYIRKRGYEKASVILQPAPESLTRTWLPSENIACQIKTPEAAVSADGAVPFEPGVLSAPAKYVLVEGSDAATIDKIKSNFPNLPPATRIALFGAAPSPPNTRLPYPYVGLPTSLDNLVERLDTRPASDRDPKLAPQQHKAT
jgi:hypothetical protein